MIKKHLITCSTLLGLILTVKVFILIASPDRTTIQPSTPEILQPQQPFVSYFETLSFANEELPLGDERVEWKMKNMLNKHDFENLQTSKLHQKASKWFPLIEPILKAYHIPQDFKYVPLVESGLSSGTSPKGASGYWQFMPQTARDFGLTVNGDLDERQHLKKSTIAACKYLNSLYKEFNSWTLAAAAYNIGENGLKRQIAKQRQDNYFKMKLNRETGAYIYKLISMKEIIEKPLRYGYSKAYSNRVAKLDISKPDKIDFANFASNENDLMQMQTLVL